MSLVAVDGEDTAAQPAGMDTDCSDSRGESFVGSRTPSEMKAIRSHSEAERRRRQRINGHLATLRSLLPSATRMDKAALLGEVVRHVTELKGKVSEADVAIGVVPSEGDEVGVEEVEEQEEEEPPAASDGGGVRRRKRRLRAWVSCPDRAGLMGELSRAVRSVKGRVVRVEMVTLGGRTRSLLELEITGATARGGGEARPALQAALLAVLLPDRPGPGDGFKRSRLSSRLTAT